MDLVSWESRIEAAHRRISKHVLKTPLIRSPFLSELNKGEVFLKLESEQYTGSFKARGAINRVLSCSDSDRKRGFIAASTGNHAQGFARALEISKSSGTIFLPENADSSKVEALKSFGVDLVFYGTDILSTELYAKEAASRDGKIWISPYNDEEVIAGQGTIAAEITSELSEIDSILGCVGGGGMMSGVASWFKKRSPSTHIYGCLPENSPEMYLSVKQGKVVVLEEAQYTLSDGSAGGLEEDSITFDICRSLIDEYETVTESEISEAIKFMVDKHHKIIEGAAGVAVAGFKKIAEKLQGKKVVIIICGANISTKKLVEILTT